MFINIGGKKRAPLWVLIFYATRSAPGCACTPPTPAPIFLAWTLPDAAKKFFDFSSRELEMRRGEARVEANPETGIHDSVRIRHLTDSAIVAPPHVGLLQQIAAEEQPRANLI